MLQLSLIDTVSFAYTFWLTLLNVGFLLVSVLGFVSVLEFVLLFGFWSGFGSGFGVTFSFIVVVALTALAWRPSCVALDNINPEALKFALPAAFVLNVKVTLLTSAWSYKLA